MNGLSLMSSFWWKPEVNLSIIPSQPLELSLPPLENGSSSKDDIEQLGKGLASVISIAKDGEDTNNDQLHECEDVSTKFKSERESETEAGKERLVESNGGDHISNENGGTIQKLGPGMESSPLSDSEKVKS